MSGSYFYDFVDTNEAKSYRRVSYLAKKRDKNNFFFSNSPYLLLYEKPVGRGPLILISKTPPSPPTTLDSPAAPAPDVDRAQDSVVPQNCDDPGVEGIDEYGTNTFQIHTWMTFAPTKNVGVANPDPSSTSTLTAQESEHEEDYETDTEFERACEQEMEAMDLETHGGMGEDAAAFDAFLSDDVVLESSHPAKEVVFPSTQDEGLIVISDDEDIDHSHSPDDDEEDHDGVPKVKEMKPLVLPSGSVIKVKKDYWKLEEEKHLKRIARRAEREAKDKELQDVVANTAKTKAKMLRL